MIEILPAADHVVGLKIAGTITGHDIDRATAAVEAALGRHDRIGLFADAVEWSGMTPEAFAKDLRYGLGKIGEWGRFARAAVVTDKEWLRGIVRLEDRLFPRIELKAFPESQRDEAFAWASEPPEPVPPHAAGLKLFATTRPDTFAFDWDGSISAEDMRAVTDDLNSAMDVHGKIRLLGRILHLGGISPVALLQSGLFTLKVQGWRKVDRYALVGGPGWVKSYAGFIGSTFGVNVRHFEAEREQEAWDWLEAKPLA